MKKNVALLCMLTLCSASGNWDVKRIDLSKNELFKNIPFVNDLKLNKKTNNELWFTIVDRYKNGEKSSDIPLKVIEYEIGKYVALDDQSKLKNKCIVYGSESVVCEYRLYFDYKQCCTKEMCPFSGQSKLVDYEKELITQQEKTFAFDDSNFPQVSSSQKNKDNALVIRDFLCENNTRLIGLFSYKNVSLLQILGIYSEDILVTISDSGSTIILFNKKSGMLSIYTPKKEKDNNKE